MIKNIIKRNGKKEAFSAEKLNGWSEWAAEKLGRTVNWSEVVLNTVSSLPETCTSQQLQENLIQYCLTKNTWEYNLMAGRLYAALLIRIIHKSDEYPTVKEVHTKLMKAGLMRRLSYSDAEYAEVEKIINHDLNLTYPHYALHQNRRKYALQNKAGGVEYETSQFIYMRMAMAAAEFEPLDIRMQEVKEYYIEFAKHRGNVPTPYYVNLGTHLSGFASCNVMTTKDTARSLAAADHITYMMTVMSAGIGYHLKTRSINDPVRGGAIEHQGKVPYIKSYVGALHANLQCYAEDTQILTQNGYVDFKDLNDDSLIAQVNNDGTLEYVKPDQIVTYAHDGEMVEFSIDNRVISSITPNHRVVYRDVNTPDEYKVTLAEDFIPTKDKLIDVVDPAEFSMDILTTWERVDKKSVPYNGNVYCVTVPSGMIIVKYKDFAMVSGNSGRGGAGTLYYNAYDPEVETIIKLKNPMTPLTRQVRGSDYSFGSNRMVVLAAAKNEDIALFSYRDAPELYEAMYSSDQDYFEELYQKFIDSNLPRRMISARQVVQSALTEAFETGRHYEHFTDHMNTHTPFRDKIYSSNLCVTGDTLIEYIDEDDNTYTDTIFNFVNTFNEGKKRYYAKSYDITTKRVAYSLIEDAGQTSNTDVVYQITDNYGYVVSCTPDHEIYTSNRGYICAKDIVAGDSLVVYRNDSTDASRVVTVRVDMTPHPMYDIKVANTKCFFANNVLVHNCVEIALPTVGFNSVEELYQPYNDELNFIEFNTGKEKHHLYNFDYVETQRGRVDAMSLRIGDVYDGKPITKIIQRSHAPEIALCNIGGIIVSNINSDKEYANSAYRMLKLIRYGILHSEYVFQNLADSAKKRMNAGVGIVGLAHLMAKKGLAYDSQEGKNYIHEVAETHAWHLYNAALRIGKEYGNAEWMHKTKWPEGWTPLSSYNKNVDSLVTVENKRDWDSLSKEIVANGGIGFSVCIAHMPSESCLESSTKIKTTKTTYDIELENGEKVVLHPGHQLVVLGPNNEHMIISIENLKVGQEIVSLSI